MAYPNEETRILNMSPEQFIDALRNIRRKSQVASTRATNVRETIAAAADFIRDVDDLLDKYDAGKN